MRSAIGRRNTPWGWRRCRRYPVKLLPKFGGVCGRVTEMEVEGMVVMETARAATSSLVSRSSNQSVGALLHLKLSCTDCFDLCE